MSNEEKDTFGKYLPNYKINLVDAKKLAKENCLNSDLQYVLGMLEYKKKEEIDMCKALDDLYQDGVEKGENRYSQLILKLSELGLTELLVKAASDSDYRDSLYMKYNIK